MEPITISLVAAVAIGASTLRPKWEESLRPEISPNTLVLSTMESSTAPFIERRINSANTAAPANAPKDRLFGELMGFVPTGAEDPSVEPVSKIEDILVANEFLRKLPGSVPLPILMRNDGGEIGMYWDNDRMLINVDIESESTVSLYLRDQITGKRSYTEDVQIAAVDALWFETKIGEMLTPDAVIS